MLAREGCTIDVTAFPPGDDDSTVSAADAIERFLESDIPAGRLTVSSDGGGCLPVFDDEGRATGMEVGSPSELLRCLASLLGRGVPLEKALPPFTSNVADHLRLPGKGLIALRKDADLLVLDADGGIRDVMANCRWMVRDGAPVRRGPFEG